MEEIDFPKQTPWNPQPQIHQCSICGKKSTWKDGWEWRYQWYRPFHPDGWEKLVITCSPACRRIDEPRFMKNQAMVEKAINKRFGKETSK